MARERGLMLKQRRLVAEQVAAALFEAERAIDVALAKTAGLTGIMPSLRAEAGLSALIGQDALERATDAVSALAQARRSIVETHKQLTIAQHDIGLGAVAIGDDVVKPPGIEAPSRHHLRRAS